VLEEFADRHRGNGGAGGGQRGEVVARGVVEPKGALLDELQDRGGGERFGVRRDAEQVSLSPESRSATPYALDSWITPPANTAACTPGRRSFQVR
jgi:hypothetical protein